jgi:hypothetical protein
LLEKVVPNHPSWPQSCLACPHCLVFKDPRTER